MNHVKLCTSLELSRQLKEAGVAQSNLFWWHIHNGNDGKTHEKVIFGNDEEFREDGIKVGWYDCSAFTAVELGEMLPEYYYTERSDGVPKNARWACSDWKKGGHRTIASTEADARAKMLLWLIENGHVKTEDLK